jgi:hypothetical protein
LSAAQPKGRPVIRTISEGKEEEKKNSSQSANEKKHQRLKNEFVIFIVLNPPVLTYRFVGKKVEKKVPV